MAYESQAQPGAFATYREATSLLDWKKIYTVAKRTLQSTLFRLVEGTCRAQ